MRILHVYKDFDPPIHGGMERHIALMCRYQRQWAEVEALVCGRSFCTRVEEHEGVRVTAVGELGRFQRAPVSPFFPFYMRLRAADVVVVHVPNPTAEVGYLLARPHGALVVRYHSDVVRQAAAMRFYGPVQMRFLRKAAVIIPTSEQYVKTSPVLTQIAGENGSGPQVRVVPLGIVPDEFNRPDLANVANLRKLYGGAKGEYVLFSGMHRYYKGLKYLVRAASYIHAPVVIAGDGPERLRLEALARNLQVPVCFPGPLSHAELVDHLHGCAVFVFPSVERSEAFGISMLEAQACGKPIVATRLGTGVEYVNLQGRTGYNVEPRDPQALAEAVNTLLASADLRRQMGEWARLRVDREFTAEQTARKEFVLYQEAMG